MEVLVLKEQKLPCTGNNTKIRLPNVIPFGVLKCRLQ